MFRVPLALLLLTGPLPLRPTRLQENPPPQQVLPGHGRVELSFVGTATRQRFHVDFYVMTLYVDLRTLRRRLDPSARQDPAAIARALASGEVPILFRNHFLLEAGGEANLRFTHESLRRYWPDATFDPDAAELRSFNRYFGTTVRRDHTGDVWVDGRGSLLFGKMGQKPVVSHVPNLARAFAAMYFADPPRDPEFRKTLLEGCVKALAGEAPRP